MRKLIRCTIFFPVLFFLSSCEDVIQVKLDEGSKLYVVDAFVNDLREPQIIKVNYNDSYFSNRDPQPVPGAQVIVRDLTSGKDFSFADEGAGKHVLRLNDGDTLARVGHQYELRVTVSGVTYKALSLEKRTGVIYDIDTNYVSGGSFQGRKVQPFYFCELKAMDLVAGETDYYWVKTLRNDTLLFGPDEMGISFCIDGTGGPVTGIDADSINFTQPVTLLGFKAFLPGDKCEAQIHSISRETYNFFIQLAQQVNNGGLFATTPENVRTNITTPKDAQVKAIGWFNMATVARKAIVIP
jgi:hypothetical protein